MGNFIDYSDDDTPVSYGGASITSPKAEPGKTVNQLLKASLYVLLILVLLGFVAACVVWIAVILSAP